MIGAIIKTLGAVNLAKSAGGGESQRSIADTVKEVESTQTGQFALQIAKGGVTLVLIIVGLGIFMSIRATNRMFGESKKQMSVSRDLSLKARLYDYYKIKDPDLKDSEVTNKVNSILNES